jgi:hypothetical protein
MKFEEANRLIKVLKGDGHMITLLEWQEHYELPRGSKQIGKNFWYSESRFMQDIHQFDELIVSSLLMRLLDAFRKRVMRPVRISSFNRTDEYQQKLKARGYKTAKFSPHVVKLACDIDTDTPHQTRAEAKMLREEANKLNIACRIGFEDYLKNGQTFIHLDICPEYFAPGKPWHELPHPVQWETQTTW